MEFEADGDGDKHDLCHRRSSVINVGQLNKWCPVIQIS